MDKLTKIKLKWLNDNFNLDKMKMYKHDYYPNSIFYKKGDIFVINQDLKNKKFWIDYNQIWSFFESFFGMEYTEIQSIMNIWLEETDKLREYRPFVDRIRSYRELEETDKLREYTPKTGITTENLKLEETDKLREYTPEWRFDRTLPRLEETDKLREYTPELAKLKSTYVLKETDKLSEYTPKQ